MDGEPDAPAIAAHAEPAMQLRQDESQAVENLQLPWLKGRFKRGVVPRAWVGTRALLLTTLLVVRKETFNGKLPAPDFTRHRHLADVLSMRSCTAVSGMANSGGVVRGSFRSACRSSYQFGASSYKMFLPISSERSEEVQESRPCRLPSSPSIRDQELGCLPLRRSFSARYRRSRTGQQGAS